MLKNSQSPDHLGIQGKGGLKIWLNKISAHNNLLSFILLIPRKIVRIKRKRDLANFYHQHQKDIDDVFNLADDDISKEVIKTQLAFIKDYDYSTETDYLKNNGLLERHTHLLDKNEYFPEGIMHLNDDEVFVDGGGFNGDTVRDFIKRSKGNFDRIFSFEPDKDNYPDLVSTVKELALDQNKITCYPFGLYSENKKIKFNQRGIGSTITDDGTETIEVVRLDSFLSDNKKTITFIKLDVEGAELEALEGMKDIIKNHKPKLAVCVYHKTEHFWKVPFLIKSINPEYKIYFRQHALSRLETVCYAV